MEQPIPNPDHSRGWQANLNEASNYSQAYSEYLYAVPYQAPRMQAKKQRRPWLAFIVAIVVLMAVGYFNTFHTSASPTKTVPTVAEREGSGYGFALQPNDPLYANQYALQHLNAPAAWQVTQGNPDIVVAVVDTGVDANHPDLKGKLVQGYDFVDDDTTPEDTLGHGTFVASLIAASGNDKNGIIGLAPGVKIMPLKVLGRNGAGDSLKIALAIRYAADNGAKVINLSLGGPNASRAIRQATDYAIGRGVVVVAAAGNEAQQGNPVEYPASFPDVISVGATGPTDRIASFSNHNTGVNVSAPGVNILGARSEQNRMCRPYNGSAYCVSSGTSFAAPYVSATAALMLSVNPKLTPQQVDSILEKTATDLGSKGADEYYGAGLVNTAQAVNAARA